VRQLRADQGTGNDDHNSHERRREFPELVHDETSSIIEPSFRPVPDSTPAESLRFNTRGAFYNWFASKAFGSRTAARVRPERVGEARLIECESKRLKTALSTRHSSGWRIRTSSTRFEDDYRVRSIAKPGDKFSVTCGRLDPIAHELELGAGRIESKMASASSPEPESPISISSGRDWFSWKTSAVSMFK
jgi:hypothetical protein